MADAPNLPTDVAPGDPGHAGLHNDVNRAVNLLRNDVDTLETPPDTGWLNLNSGILPMYLRRIGSTVILTSPYAEPAANTYVEATLPQGGGFDPVAPIELGGTNTVAGPMTADDFAPMFGANSYVSVHVSPGEDTVVAALYGVAWGGYRLEWTTVDPFPAEDDYPGTRA